MKILAFIHTYSPDGEFDNYMVEVIAGFEKIGVQLYVIKSNDLVNSAKKVNRYIDKRIDKYTKKIVEKIQPDLIFSTNRGGISQSIIENFKLIPIITLMVDLMFYKRFRPDGASAFQENDYLVTPIFAGVKEFEKKFPVLKGRVHFLPFCTRKEDFNHETPKEINISFVGNLFGKYDELYKMIKKNDKEFRDGIFKFINEVRQNYHLDVDYYLKKYNLTNRLKAMGRDPEKLLYLAANIISNNNRIKTLDALSDLGLEIYGPEKWALLSGYSYPLTACHHFGKYVKTRQELCHIYGRSKIGINICHHQATTGLGYRVFDLLASSALLITNFHEDSDLIRLFGEDHGVPIYRTPEELRQKVIYYLDHEDKRKELVAYCNQLVAKGFSFEERATQLIQIPYPDFVPSASKQHKTTYIPIPKFYTWGT